MRAPLLGDWARWPVWPAAVADRHRSVGRGRRRRDPAGPPYPDPGDFGGPVRLIGTDRARGRLPTASSTRRSGTLERFQPADLRESAGLERGSGTFRGARAAASGTIAAGAVTFLTRSLA